MNIFMLLSGMDRRVLFVINPISGNIDKEGLVNEIPNIIRGYPCSTHLFFTTGENDSISLRENINDFQPDTLVAVGGDGTIHMICQEIVRKDISLGIVPMGSSNGIAKELNISTNIEEALLNVFHGQLRYVDVIFVNDSFVSIHLSDIGLNAELIQLYDTDNTRGWWGYAKQFFKAFNKRKKYSFNISNGESTWRKKGAMLAFANGNMYGYGGIINPIGSINDGKMEVCIVRSLNWKDLFRYIIPFFQGRIDQTDILTIYKGNEFYISCSSKLPLQVDGEHKGIWDTFQAEVWHHAIQVWVA